MASRSVSKEIQTVRKSLSSISRALQRLAPAIETAAAGAASPARGRRKLKLSSARRSALKLQGRYMGYLRNLAPRLKPRVKELRAKKGIRAAIALARRLGRQ